MKLQQKLGRHVAILGDLQGPKNPRLYLQRRQNFSSTLATNSCSTPTRAKGEGDKEKVGIDYKGLPADVVPGDILLLDDGRVQLKVPEVQGMKVFHRSYRWWPAI